MECRVLLSVLERGTVGGQQEVSANLDSAVWSRLPDEVLEIILLMLPTASKFRFRAVSRAWHKRLSCPGFLELSASCFASRTSMATGMLCALNVFDRGNVASPVAYKAKSNPYSFKVVELDLSFIPPKWRRPMFDVFQDEGGLLCVKSGLACLADFRKINEVRICVINPFTRIAKELPILRPQEVCVEGKTRLCGAWEMSVEVDKELHGRFKVTLFTGIQKLGANGKENNKIPTGSAWGFFVYTSEDNEWKLTEGQYIYPPWEDDSRQTVLHAVCDGYLYTLSDDDGEFMMHDLQTGEFRFVDTDNLPESASIEVSLLEFRGEVYYIVAGLPCENGGLLEICKFNRVQLVWEEFTVLPMELQKDLLSSSGSSLQNLHVELGSADAVGESICIRLDICLGNNWETPISQQLVCCCVATKEWRVVLRDFHENEFNRFQLFEPRLAYFP